MPLLPRRTLPTPEPLGSGTLASEQAPSRPMDKSTKNQQGHPKAKKKEPGDFFGQFYLRHTHTRSGSISWCSREIQLVLAISFEVTIWQDEHSEWENEMSWILSTSMTNACQEENKASCAFIVSIDGARKYRKAQSVFILEINLSFSSEFLECTFSKGQFLLPGQKNSVTEWLIYGSLLSAIETYRF